MQRSQLSTNRMARKKFSDVEKGRIAALGIVGAKTMKEYKETGGFERRERNSGLKRNKSARRDRAIQIDVVGTLEKRLKSNTQISAERMAGGIEIPPRTFFLSSSINWFESKSIF